MDNSLVVKLASTPLARFLPAREKYVQCVKDNGIRPGDATDIRAPDGSVEVLYTSHMLEHLDQHEAGKFLAEAKRVLKPGGILRIVVPDIRASVERYLQTEDADAFIAGTHMATAKPRSIVGKLKFALLTGFRDHHWMYDAKSLARLLTAAGFKDPRVQAPGKTTIPEPGALNLREREEESLYMEATR